jgi:hypothetical protein
MEGLTMGITDLMPQTMLMKAVVAAVALAILEAPAMYLYASRAAVEADLTKSQASLATANTNLGTTRAQLASSQSDLKACGSAAKASSDSIGLMQQRALAAEALAKQLALSNSKQAATFAATIKTRDGQINTAAAGKESCDDALKELRAGR